VKIYIVVLGLIVMQSCNQTKEMKIKAIDKDNMDLTVSPGDDFNQYANGGWMKNNPIPEDKSRYGTFDELMDKNEKQLRELVEDIARTEHEDGTVAQKIATYYNSGMDTVTIEKEGIDVLEDEFGRIDKINTTQDVQKQLSYFHSHLISSAFGLYGGADAKNSDMVISHLYQSGLGLPDRDYYLSSAKRFVDIREAYKKHIAKMFTLLGATEEEAMKKSKDVYDFELQLAKASMDRIERRDPHKTYHKKTVEELEQMSPNFNWNSYLKDINLSNVENIIVAQPDFIEEFDKMLVDKSIDDWKNYFRWNLINSTSSYLNKDFVEAHFDFYGKILSGTPVMKPRWKRVLGSTNSMLSEAVGQMYVEKYFPPQAKERMLKLVDNLKIALGERIDNLEWMGDSTKENAQEKLKAIRVKIGYPDKWKDYSKLEVKSNLYVLNMLSARNFAFNDMINKIDKPVDKTEWHMPPQMVNAYYSPTQNEIVFPAGILQPPFFFLDGDDAVNYGAIGVVIGHEMTHGFDDKGRLYDKDGNLNEWWTKDDAKRFEERANVLVKQFDEFVVLDSIKANGKFTLGENIADLGGVNISYTAFKKTEQWKNRDEKIDGFTADQRFFLAYAHVWAQNIRDKEILRRTQDDVHSLGKYRVIGPLRNVEEYHQAFDIKEGDYMFLPKSKRAIIW
jgi:putative endopeptidase